MSNLDFIIGSIFISITIVALGVVIFNNVYQTIVALRANNILVIALFVAICCASIYVLSLSLGKEKLYFRI